MPDATKVSLLRYEDPEAGWRKMPDIDKIMDGKLVVEAGQTFHVDPAAGKVSLSVNGSTVDIGLRMLYMVKD